ncbi:TPA: anti-phage protein KwaA, partial [Vibrio cholerae]
MVDSKFKIKLYILSLALLFLIVFVMTVKLPQMDASVCKDGCELSVSAWFYKDYIIELAKSNVLPILMLLLLLISWFIKHELEHLLDGGAEQVIRVIQIENQDYEHLTFLATYIIPFFGFTFDDPRRLIAYFILLVLIGMMFIKTDKYFANPSLAILGFKLYKATLANSNGIYESVILISRDVIIKDSVVKYKL